MMIPLYKLEKLPRTQKLRKIAKIFTFAENQLCLASGKNEGAFSEAEFIFFAEAAKLLAGDELFAPEAQKLFREAAVIFRDSHGGTGSTEDTEENDKETAQIRRALNSVRHLLLAETGRDQADWDFIDEDGKLDPAKRQIFEGMQVYLEDIRSPFNVGAMFRTAESFGVEKIFLSPFCADPNHQRAQRTAKGCTDIVSWERRDLFGETETPALRCPIFALETGGIPLDEFHFPRNGLLIAGSEELGVSPRALAAADASLGRVSIPCYGAKGSLNVSVAFGIAVCAWVRCLN